MKFAKVFEKTLIEDEIPEEWIEAAIQYKALKKCISKVVDELNTLGLQQEALKLLIDKVEVNQEETTAANPIVAQYVLNKTENSVVPTLKIVVDYSTELTDEYIDDSVDQIRRDLEKIVLKSDNDTEIDEEDILSPKTTVNHVPDSHTGTSKKYEISIRLNSDAKFFEMLNEELQNLDHFQDQEQQRMVKDIEDISHTLEYLSSKTSLRKSDIYTWRQLFEIFLNSEIYFKYNQISDSERSLDQVKENLQKYHQQIDTTGLVRQFKNKKSLQAFSQFLQVNDYLLKVLQFQDINTTAFTKILKKFDKQTSLNVKQRLPKLISNDHVFFTGKSISQSICYIIQRSLLQIVPQLEDYTCPVCLDVAFKPIRLECGHLFCVRCLVKLKSDNKLDCPLCRSQKAIDQADASNLDYETMQLMQRVFPKEVKRKMKDRDQERYKEVFGDRQQCTVM